MSRSFQNTIRMFIIVVAGLCTIIGFNYYLAERDSLLFLRGWLISGFMGTTWLVLGIAVVILSIKQVRILANQTNGKCDAPWTWRSFRLIAYIAFAAILYSTILCEIGVIDEWSKQLRWLTYSLFLIGTACFFLFSTRGAEHNGNTNGESNVRYWDVIAGNILVLLLGGEFTLEIYSRIKPNPLFYNPHTIEMNLKAHRKAPGYIWYGFQCNSGGYLDKNFIVGEPNDFVVASIGDSFGFGVVPYEYNFNTVSETILQRELKDEYNRIAVHNFGAVAIGPNEYAYLLKQEVPRAFYLWQKMFYQNPNMMNTVRNHVQES